MTVTARRTLTLADLFRPERRRDPYALYRELRQRNPVYWDQPMRSWVVLSYAEVVALTRDHRLSEDRVTPFYERLPPDKRATLAPLARALSNMMLFNDPPRHTRLRALARKAFTPRMVDELQPAVERTVDRLLARVAGRGRMDVIGDLSEPLTCDVIADMLSVPQRDRPLLTGWTSLLHEFFMQSHAEVSRVGRLREVFDELSADRRRAPGPDLLSRMLAAQAETQREAGGRLSDDELFATFLLLIDAGQVTTTHFIANALRALLAHPDQTELLRERPELVPGAVHELMRYDSPVQFTTRIALDDIEVGGECIGSGQSVMLVVGSGNRDPQRFPDPDRLDVTRAATDQLSFGHGIHYCLGAPLALRESEVVLTTLLLRTRKLRLDAADADIAWHDTINFRFLRSLPIAFTVS